jgi:hypothetical protein
MPSHILSDLRRWTARSGVSGGALALLLAAALSAPATASASTDSTPSPTGKEDPHRYCVRVYGTAASATEASPLRYTYCSTEGREDAYANLNSPATQARLGRYVTFASRDLLMTWYENANYNIDEGDQTDIYGDEGPCDSAGYRIAPNSDWDDNISSIAGTAACTKARLTNRSLDYAETQSLPTPYVGDRLNDNIGLIHVYNG